MFGSLTITGSLMAFGKLQGLLPSPPVTYKFQNAIDHFALFVLAVIVLIYLFLNPSIRPVCTLAFFTR